MLAEAKAGNLDVAQQLLTRVQQRFVIVPPFVGKDSS